MLQQIDHVNIVTADLAAMVRFYRDVLGLAVTKEVRISGPWIEQVVGLAGVDADVVYLESPAGGARLELIHYRSPTALPSAQPGQPHRLGLRHLAFRVRDLEGLEARLRRAGVGFVGRPQQVPDAQVRYADGVRKHLVYFHDPEGNLLELCEYR